MKYRRTRTVNRKVVQDKGNDTNINTIKKEELNTKDPDDIQLPIIGISEHETLPTPQRVEIKTPSYSILNEKSGLQERVSLPNINAIKLPETTEILQNTIIQQNNNDDEKNKTINTDTKKITGEQAELNPTTKVHNRKRREENFTREDFRKPFPIGQKQFCRFDEDGLYHGAIIRDRRKQNEFGEIIPDPEQQEKFRQNIRFARRRNMKRINTTLPTIQKNNISNKLQSPNTNDNSTNNTNLQDTDTNMNIKNECIKLSDMPYIKQDPSIINTNTSTNDMQSNIDPIQEKVSTIQYNPNKVNKQPKEWKEHYYSYYIHYLEWDRRMDEWVDKDRLRLPEFVSDEEISSLDYIQEEAKTLDNSYDKQTPLLQQYKITSNDTRRSQLEKLLCLVNEIQILKSRHGSFSMEDIAAHEEATCTKNVTCIWLGRYALTTWYYSPFPSEYSKYSTLYFCEYCLTFFGMRQELQRHERWCELRHPPGTEIYRYQQDEAYIAVFEVDGEKESTYCENLCYIAKLFLDHKTLEYDCTPFLFYILCEINSRGYHVVGYFSKEKVSVSRYNLACILTLPCHQRKGYGKFLISLSYEQSKIERKVGSPEKPISDLGQVSYQSYWSSILLDYAERRMNDDIWYSVKEQSEMTCIEPDDIIETLKTLQVQVFYHEGWVVSRTRLEVLRQERWMAEKQREQKREKDKSIFISQCYSHLLHWTPYFAKSSDIQHAIDSNAQGTSGGYGIGGGPSRRRASGKPIYMAS